MRDSFQCVDNVLSKRSSVDTLNNASICPNSLKRDIATHLRASIPKIFGAGFVALFVAPAENSGSAHEEPHRGTACEMWTHLGASRPIRRLLRHCTTSTMKNCRVITYSLRFRWPHSAIHSVLVHCT